MLRIDRLLILAPQAPFIQPHPRGTTLIAADEPTPNALARLPPIEARVLGGMKGQGRRALLLDGRVVGHEEGEELLGPAEEHHEPGREQHGALRVRGREGRSRRDKGGAFFDPARGFLLVPELHARRVDLALRGAGHGELDVADVGDVEEDVLVQDSALEVEGVLEGVEFVYRAEHHRLARRGGIASDAEVVALVLLKV